MKKERKPRAYMEKKIVGHFCFEPVVEWIAYNYWGNSVGYGKTRKDCEADCRRNGYVPERG